MQTLKSLDELANVPMEQILGDGAVLGTSTDAPTGHTAWEHSVDRHEVAFIRKVAKIERMLRRNDIRFSYEDDKFVLARYSKGSEYPLLGYVRINDSDYSFGTEELDYTWSTRVSDIVYAVKCWMNGMSFKGVEKLFDLQ